MRKILTISIAAYNVEQYLQNTLQSLVPPDGCGTLEVIVVDDGSKDATADIAESFCQKYPDTFRLIKKKNGGYGSTINAALDEATGKYFKLLDGDDWFQDGVLEDYLGYLGSVDCDLVISPYNIVHMPKKQYELVDTHTELSEVPVDINKTNITGSITHQELTVRTEILKKNQTHITENCFYTDQEFVFESVLYSDTIARFQNPIYCYQVGREGQSVSISGLRKHYPDSMKVANKLYTLFDGNKVKYGVGKKKILKRKILGAASVVYLAYMVRPDRKEAKKELMAFDTMTRTTYPEIYEITNGLKRARMLRKTKFAGFSLMCRLAAKG